MGTAKKVLTGARSKKSGKKKAKIYQKNMEIINRLINENKKPGI